jgi:hypothetical protein
MKNKLLFLSILICTFVFVSCDDLFSDDDDDNDNSSSGTLYVKFCNPPESSYTITAIELKSRGNVVGTKSSVIGGTINLTSDWGSNILPAGIRLAPGKHVFFNLNLPSGQWAQYRVRVDDGNGNSAMIDYQGFSDSKTDLPITHWGGSDRTVKSYISYLENEDRIWINGQSDWVGIESDEVSKTTGVDL